MDVDLNGRSTSVRPPIVEALQAIRLAEANGREPMVLAYAPVATVNPFQYLLYRRFAEVGIGVLPLFDREQAWSLAALTRLGVPVVFHLHWTNWVLDPATDADDAEARVDDAIEWLSGLKRSGLSLVWTVHNVLPHDVVYVEAQVRLQRWLADNVDVVHVMSANTAEAAKDSYSLQPDRTVHVPHPNYVGAYPDHLSREQARFALGIDPDEIVYVMAGAIKGYKGIDRLLPALDSLPSTPARRLLVAGKSDSFAETQAFVEDCRKHALVLIDDRRIPAEDMQIYLRAADLAILPYQRALNSGAVMLALSFGLPVVAPRIGGLGEVLTPACAETFDPADPAGFAAALLAADRLVALSARQAAVARATEFDPDRLSLELAGQLRDRLLG